MVSVKMLPTISSLFLLVTLVTFTSDVECLDDVPEFQYPCYVDVCTFPRQYCNSDRHERRCSTCSQSICREERLPTACKYICMKYAEAISTTTKRPVSVEDSNTESRHDDERLYSVTLVMTYSAVTSTLVLIILLITITACIVRKFQKDRPKLLSVKQASFRSATGKQTDQERQELISDLIGRLETQKTSNNSINSNSGNPLLCGNPVANVQPTSLPPLYRTLEPTEAAVHSGPNTPEEPASSQESPVHYAGPPLQQIQNNIKTNPTVDSETGHHDKPWKLNNYQTGYPHTSTDVGTVAGETEETSVKM